MELTLKEREELEAIKQIAISNRTIEQKRRIVSALNAKMVI